MESFKKSWFKIPGKIRKPVVLIIGLFFVIAAGLTGWLPGPGGIPLFLVGVAILATEFRWAERLRDKILSVIHWIGAWLRRHPAQGSLIIGTGIVAAITVLYIILN